jgi:hypothetical protein
MCTFNSVHERNVMNSNATFISSALAESVLGLSHFSFPYSVRFGKGRGRLYSDQLLPPVEAVSFLCNNCMVFLSFELNTL